MYEHTRTRFKHTRIKQTQSVRIGASFTVLISLCQAYVNSLHPLKSFVFIIELLTPQ